MRINGLNHFNIACKDLERSTRFYENLGLVRGHRPQFSTVGVWLYAGEQPIVHLNDAHEVGPIVEGTAAVHHVGFTVHGGVNTICAQLMDLGIDYDLWPAIPGVSRACYFKGPDGESIELVMVDNFVPLPRETIKVSELPMPELNERAPANA